MRQTSSTSPNRTKAHASEADVVLGTHEGAHSIHKRGSVAAQAAQAPSPVPSKVGREDAVRKASATPLGPLLQSSGSHRSLPAEDMKEEDRDDGVARAAQEAGHARHKSRETVGQSKVQGSPEQGDSP